MPPQTHSNNNNLGVSVILVVGIVMIPSRLFKYFFLSIVNLPLFQHINVVAFSTSIHLSIKYLWSAKRTIEQKNLLGKQ